MYYNTRVLHLAWVIIRLYNKKKFKYIKNYIYIYRTKLKMYYARLLVYTRETKLTGHYLCSGFNDFHYTI